LATRPQEEQRDKKPEDLRRAIGRIDSQDWNVKAGPAVCRHLHITIRYLAVLGIRAILVRIRISDYWGTAPDPAIFVSDHQDGIKKLFFF
jgi:hypothetical protein